MSFSFFSFRHAGITKTKIDKLGMRASDTAIIHMEAIQTFLHYSIFPHTKILIQNLNLSFQDVRVPASNVIGEEGMGFTYQMMQFQEERLAVAAQSLLAMDMAIDETIEYAR